MNANHFEQICQRETRQSVLVRVLVADLHSLSLRITGRVLTMRTYESYKVQDEVIIKIKLEQYICISTMGIIIVSIWSLISLITNWSDFKSRTSNNSVVESRENGHEKTKVKVRIVIVFSVSAFTRRALRGYRHTRTHHLFYLKIGTVYSLTLIVTTYTYS